LDFQCTSLEQLNIYAPTSDGVPWCSAIALQEFAEAVAASGRLAAGKVFVEVWGGCIKEANFAPPEGSSGTGLVDVCVDGTHFEY